ncbi:hypothetical protein HUJ04_000990 [Dendroctonus ponderosae]|uniref:Amino acid transporter transmembrane domain-containing protein n=1 Tax=Dendroctonus ponderosae TaxID=77166 RepID=A0AAR5QJP6_DENPD|nr:hypothetical protein HUJ04_000990 [Dendroctonus ponderosae]KAH1011669.1 hypothetical protein HUJ04_000990 [Dendroctonus ponderosae]
MRDIVRNFKKIIAGGNRDSDSDESQPLLSSTSTSSSSSFESIFNPFRATSESEQGSESENCTLVSPNPLQSNLIRNKCRHQQDSESDLEPTVLTVSAAEHFFYNNDNSYVRIADLIRHDPMNIQTNQNAPKPPLSSGEASFNGFMDYKDSETHTHNSVVTIFAIWNTTMGSSLLAMSWGIQMAGLFPGIAINILIAALCLYTCHLLLTVNEKHGMPGIDIEVSHLCQNLLGKWAEVLAKIFSIVVLLGADIVYMILMSNFLYNSVYFLYDLLTNPADPMEANATVLCLKDTIINVSAHSALLNPISATQSLFEKVWDLYSTVPVILAVIMFCVLNFKSPTFFTKFNSLGTISVMYLLMFVAVKAYSWGINISDWSAEFQLKSTFSALSGMLSLSYFIHNIIISIMRNNRHQEHNGRDLTIAFGLITFTYLFIGILFYISFPLAKSCIEDNIFNNFSKSDTMTIIARILLLFQLFTVFPLISFMLRKDILGNINQIFKNYTFGDFTYGRVMFLNACLLIICVLFACFLPKIGTLIRYTGALSGMVYVFMLPNMLKMASLKKRHKLSTIKTVWHIFIIIAGALNLLSQFFIND